MIDYIKNLLQHDKVLKVLTIQILSFLSTEESNFKSNTV